MPTTHAPSLDRLRRAVELTDQIAKLEAEFQILMGGWSSGGAVSASGATLAKAAKKAASKAKKTGGMSPEGRARVAAAMKARWAAAKKKGGKAPNARKAK